MASSRGVVVWSAVLCLAGYVWVYATGLADVPIRSDGFSYYVYLPSWFLFHDTTLAAVARDCCGGEFPDYSAIIRWPGTRRWVNAHPIGVAVMQAPLFPFAHGLTKWTNLSADGFSLYYQHAAGLAGLGWIVAGLALLRRLLLRSFSDGVVAVTLIALLLGTNLYHYATFDSAYSHPYSFFLFAAFMVLTAAWHEKPASRTSLLLGLTAGLIVLVRHTNIVFCAVFLLYGAGTGAALAATFARLRAAPGELMRIVGVAVLVIAPQLLIYHQATGNPVISSYGGLGFNWASPQIAGVLFGVEKGLFFWSPVLLVAAAGLAVLARSAKPAAAFVVPGALFLAVNTYLIASWWDWQFGGSYGHRGFVDALPVFALGLAAAFERASYTARLRALAAVVATLLVSLSVFQMIQYWYGIIPFQGTTWQLYRELFLQWR
ncbi:MAG TPA: hypothetical protein VJ813_11605 [Vicinamibacterales bacterium]|nr:hypothetical protein [Vicinamibacterales bacterium]